MQRQGKSFVPTLITGDPALATEQKQFVVDVVYTSTTGVPATYSGRFYAANPISAEAQGRGFVTKYLRPSAITAVRVLPVT